MINGPDYYSLEWAINLVAQIIRQFLLARIFYGVRAGLPDGIQICNQNNPNFGMLLMFLARKFLVCFLVI
jgi:hypothetical protein